MELETAINSGQELYDYFFDLSRRNTNNQNGRQHTLEIFVTSKVRKEVLCSTTQGRIVLDGRVKNILFENHGGGVYNAMVRNIGGTNHDV